MSRLARARTLNRTGLIFGIRMFFRLSLRLLRQYPFSNHWHYVLCCGQDKLPQGSQDVDLLFLNNLVACTSVFSMLIQNFHKLALSTYSASAKPVTMLVSSRCRSSRNG